MKRIALVVIVLVGHRAHADNCAAGDTAGGSWATMLGEELDKCIADPEACKGEPPPRVDHGKFFTGDATLALISQARANDVLAGGEVRGDLETGFRAGPQLCASVDAVGANESRLVDRVTVAFPLGFSTVAMTGTESMAARPALDAKRLYLRRPYAEREFHVDAHFLTWRHVGGDSDTVFEVESTVRATSQDAFRAELQRERFTTYVMNRGGVHLELFPITVQTAYVRGYVGSVAPSSDLVRLDPFALEIVRDDLTIHAEGGYLYHDQPLCLGGCQPFAGKLEVAFPALAGRLDLAVERSADLAIDDTFTVENRASATYAMAYKHHTLRASGFAALTKTTAATAQLTGGGGAGIDVKLPAEVALSADVEVARSYYARLDGDPNPTPQLAGLGSVRLSRTFTVNPTAPRR